MPWPLSQDYNEAVQSPASSFGDPDLKQAQVATNALGLPMPCSGNFADVYELRGAQRRWAVKCFTREIPGLRERYIEISKHLQQNPLPFMVNFRFVEEGIRIRGQWYPILKMDWVQGFTLNQFVRDNIDKPHILDTLGQIWVRLAKKLHETDIAHCDLQHGNIMLVPGSKATALGVRLVDYDGMCVPSLELLKSIEVGHPNFQHPQRLEENVYNLEVDGFSHLVIYTALRALKSGRQPLWEKYDNGDNLLFKHQDLKAPQESALFQELRQHEDPVVRRLAELLAKTARLSMSEVPLLESVVAGLPGAKPTAARAAAATAVDPNSAAPVAGAAAAENLSFADAAGTAASPSSARRAGSRTGLWIAVGIGMPVLVVLGMLAAFSSNNKDAKPKEKEGIVKADLSPVKGAKSGPAKKKEDPLPPLPTPTPAPTGFRLLPLADVALRPGEERSIEIQVARDGVNEVIPIVVEGLSEDVQAQPAKIEVGTDRAMLKLGALTRAKGGLRELKVVAASSAARSLVPLKLTVKQLTAVIPTGSEDAHTWKYLVGQPEAGWEQPAFNDTGWRAGAGAFSSDAKTTRTVARTAWNEGDIYLRTTANLGDLSGKAVALHFVQDDEIEIYLNGKLLLNNQRDNLPFNRFEYAPPGAAWTFTNGAGISAHPSGFTLDNAPCPEGRQVAVLQSLGSVSQLVKFPAGACTISFRAAQRANFNQQPQVIQVRIGDRIVGNITPTTSSYETYTTNPITVQAGEQRLTLAGMSEGDCTAFLDQIEVSGKVPLADAGFERPDVGDLSRLVAYTDPKLRELVRPGLNVIAVRCRSQGNPHLFDLGLYLLAE